MVIRLFSLSLLLTLLTANACSKAPGRMTFSNGGSDDGKPDSGNLPKAKLPEGVKQDPFKEAEKLSLATVASDDAGPKAFDFNKDLEISWLSSHEFVMSHADGQSLSYDFSTKAWSAVHQSTLRAEFQDIYDFRDSGFFATSLDGFSLRGDINTKIVRLPIPDDYDPKNLVGANPGFFAYKVGDDIHAVVAKDGMARLYPMANAPKGLSLVYPCNLHCIVWGYDGQRISLFIEGQGWASMDQTVELPQGDAVKRMAIRFRQENNPIAADAIIVQTDKGAVFAQVAASAPKEMATWEDVKILSERYCVACHLEDGYDKELTWTGLKSSIVERLKADRKAKGSMPPIETKIGQQISEGERATMLSWIEKQKQTERGEVGTGGGGTVDKDISGDLKKLADAHCMSCHADAKKTSWWLSRKGKAISMVNEGTMPKNKSVSADIKKQFETAINALK